MKFIKPIYKIENRELSLKEYNPKTGFILYSLKIPQAVEINLDITPIEIIWLYKTHQDITKKLQKRRSKNVKVKRIGKNPR